MRFDVGDWWARFVRFWRGSLQLRTIVITVVLSGTVQVEHENGTMKVHAGQAIVTAAGEWVRYSTPDGPAEYIAVCLPAFSMDTVHRDDDGVRS